MRVALLSFTTTEMNRTSQNIYFHQDYQHFNDKQQSLPVMSD